MNFGPSDTPPEIAKLQFDLWRKKSVAERMRSLHSLNESMRALSQAGLRRAHPEWSERECYLFRLKLHYGADLARRVEEDLKRRDAL